MVPIDPLKVIHQNECRSDRLERAMCALEHANRLERRRVSGRGTKYKLVEPARSRSRGRQRPEKVGGGGERHVRLGLEADDAELIR
jgi:hypothetical protein